MKYAVIYNGIGGYVIEHKEDEKVENSNFYRDYDSRQEASKVLNTFCGLE